MKRRNLQIKSLVEFYPTNPNLLGLNVNRGQVVKIRLRSARDSSIFLPYVDVLGTLIHELAHNLVSNHSSKFYKVMDELYDEVEKDEDKSFGTETIPFQGTGNRLGSKHNSKALDKSLRNMAAEAALRRQKENFGSTSIKGQGGGFILGGEPLLENTRAERKSRILDAIERRRLDNETCPAELKEQPINSAVNGSLWECPDCSWFSLPSDTRCGVCHGTQDVTPLSPKKIAIEVIDLISDDEEDSVEKEDIIFLK